MKSLRKQAEDQNRFHQKNSNSPHFNFESSKERWGVNIIPWFLTRFGRFTSYLILPFPAFFYFLFGGVGRNGIIDFNKTLYPNETFFNYFRAYSNYYYFGMGLIDRLALGMNKSLNNHESINSETILQPGSFFIGSHFGDWFYPALALSKQNSVRVSIVIDLKQTPKFQSLIRSIGGSDIQFIDSSSPKLDLALKIKVEIEAGGCVCFLGDRYYQGEKSVREIFFGKYTEFPISFYKFALLLQKPVYCFFSVKSGKRSTDKFLVFFEKIYDGREAIKEQEIAKRFINKLEKIVAKYPQQWFNFYHFWSNNTLKNHTQEKNNS